MNQVTKTMSGIVTGMDRALASMDIETVSQSCCPDGGGGSEVMMDGLILCSSAIILPDFSYHGQI